MCGFALGNISVYDDYLQRHIWVNYLNQRLADFYNDKNHNNLIIQYMLSVDNMWYEKINIIEYSLNYLSNLTKNCQFIDSFNSSGLNKYSSNKNKFSNIIEEFITNLNNHFKKLNFAYRIVDNRIVEITSEQEINTIEDAINNQRQNVGVHLKRAIELYAKRPDADYLNSIKESISAVEMLCRDITKEKTLGKALK